MEGRNKNEIEGLRIYFCLPRKVCGVYYRARMRGREKERDAIRDCGALPLHYKSHCRQVSIPIIYNRATN